MMTYMYYAVLFLAVTGSWGLMNPFKALAGMNKAGSGTTAKIDSFYDIQEIDTKGNTVDFNKFKGKVVYGVNVASKCGYTASGYALLEKISALKDDGIECVLFPSNQFGGQEPGSDAEIEKFCALRNVKGATILTKADVNGGNTRPTYRFLKQEKVMGDVAWNFAGKFIIDKSGKPIAVKSEKNLVENLQKLASK